MADSTTTGSVTDFTTVYDDDRDIIKLGVSPLWVCFYAVVYGVIILGSVVGNQLVIWSYFIEPKLRRSTNTFILSLSVADFLTGLIGVPMSVFARLFTGPYVCYESTRPLIFGAVYLMCASSIAHLLAITIDRYIAVTRPLKYNVIMTKERVKIWVLVTWISGLLFGIMPLIPTSSNPTRWVCGNIPYDAVGSNAHGIGTFVTVPSCLLVMCLCYVRIFAVARGHIKGHKERMRSQSQADEGAANKRIMRTTVTTAIVLGAFALCWIPTTFKFIVEDQVYITTSDEQMFVIQTVVEILSFGNSMVNPIIYGYRNELFRQTYKRVIREKWCRFIRKWDSGTTRRSADVKSGGMKNMAFSG